jgi:hypothetical protein
VSAAARSNPAAGTYESAGPTPCLPCSPVTSRRNLRQKNIIDTGIPYRTGCCATASRTRTFPGEQPVELPDTIRLRRSPSAADRPSAPHTPAVRPVFDGPCPVRTGRAARPARRSARWRMRAPAAGGLSPVRFQRLPGATARNPGRVSPPQPMSAGMSLTRPGGRRRSGSQRGAASACLTPPSAAVGSVINSAHGGISVARALSGVLLRTETAVLHPADPDDLRVPRPRMKAGRPERWRTPLHGRRSTAA